jgi:predicted O-methyltransferase YrrM
MLALYLLALTQKHLPGDIVEIGSWCGRSALAIGRAAAESKGTHLHCIDLFPGREDWHQDAKGDYFVSVRLGEEVNTGNTVHTTWRDVWQQQIAPVYDRWPTVLEAFQEHMVRYELVDNVTPHKGTIRSFLRERGPDFRCKMAYIDGSHDAADVRADLKAVERVMVAGAWVGFDDAFTSAAGVDEIIRADVLGNPAYTDAQQLTRKLFVARYRGP